MAFFIRNQGMNIRHTFCTFLLSCLPALTAVADEPYRIPSTRLTYFGTPEGTDLTSVLSQLNSSKVALGILWCPSDGEGTVKEAFAGSPAEKAGILRGDRFHLVNGEAISKDDPVQAFNNMVLGEPVVLDIVRESVEKQISIIPELMDPVFYAFLEVRNSDSCCSVVHPSIASGEFQDNVLQSVVNDAGQFRCDEAHAHVPSNPSLYYARQDLYMVRGENQILFTIPDRVTACVSAAEFDGENLTPEAIRQLLLQLNEEAIKSAPPSSSASVKENHSQPPFSSTENTPSQEEELSSGLTTADGITLNGLFLPRTIGGTY